MAKRKNNKVTGVVEVAMPAINLQAELNISDIVAIGVNHIEENLKQLEREKTAQRNEATQKKEKILLEMRQTAERNFPVHLRAAAESFCETGRTLGLTLKLEYTVDRDNQRVCLSVTQPSKQSLYVLNIVAQVFAGFDELNISALNLICQGVESTISDLTDEILTLRRRRTDIPTLQRITTAQLAEAKLQSMGDQGAVILDSIKSSLVQKVLALPE
jgi:hypothetical protein